MTSDQSRIAYGAVWMTGMSLAIRLIGIVSTVILARLLVPADFGVVAMCASVVAVFSVFVEFGFDVVLIQRQDRATKDHYDTVWTLRLIFSAIVSAVVFFAAGPASSYYREPVIVLPMQILALSFLLSSLESIRVVDFRKNLEFHKEAVFRVSQRLAGLLCSLSLAWYLQSFWALIAGMVVTNLVAVGLSYVMKPYVPRLTLSEVRDIFSFSIWMFTLNIVSVVWKRGSHFVLGRTGADVLGYFQISQEVTTIASQLVAAINRAAFPGYSKFAGNMEEFSLAYRRVLSIAALIAMPVGFGIMAVAPALVTVALGPQWVAAIEPMQILALHGILRALGANTQYVLYARNRPKLVTYVHIAQAAVLLPLLIVLVETSGIAGAAWSFVIVSGLTTPVLFWLAARELAMGPFSVLASIWRPLVSSILMLVPVYFCMATFADHTLVNLFLAAATGALAYFGALAMLVYIGPRTDSVELLLFRHLVSGRLARADRKTAT